MSGSENTRKFVAWTARDADLLRDAVVRTFLGAAAAERRALAERVAALEAIVKEESRRTGVANRESGEGLSKDGEPQTRAVPGGSSPPLHDPPASDEEIAEAMLRAYYEEPGSVVSTEPFSERRMVGMRAVLAALRARGGTIR